MSQRVVVGFDGSPGAGVAVRWAAREARLRGAELAAWTIAAQADPLGPRDAYRMRPYASPLEQLTDGYPVTVRHRVGTAAAELVSACDESDLLVVGSRGRGRLEELLLGSVSRACLAHAPCPVVVVRQQLEPAPPRGRVIVGIDGSSYARHALRLAAVEAELRGAALDIVHAVYWDNIGTEWLTPTRTQLVELGRRLVAAELAATNVNGRTVVVPGHPSEVLVRHSSHADLLVVGSRGHNPIAGLLLGSTSEHCARHAQCPVLVDHPSRQQVLDGRAQAAERRESSR